MNKVEKVIYLNGQIESLRNINKDLMKVLNDNFKLLQQTEKRLENKIQFRNKLNYEIEGESK